MGHIPDIDEAKYAALKDLFAYKCEDFCQYDALKSVFDENTAKKGVCAGFVVRFAQLYYSGGDVSSDALTKSVKYAQDLQSRYVAASTKLRETGGNTDRQAAKLVTINEFTGFLAFDFGMGLQNDVTQVVNQALGNAGEVRFVTMLFKDSGSHAIGLVYEKEKGWICFDPNFGIFRGEGTKLKDFFEALNFCYFAVEKRDIEKWDACSFVRTPKFQVISKFLN